MQVVVNSPNVEYTSKYIISKYDYQYVEAQKKESSIAVSLHLLLHQVLNFVH